MKIGRIGHNYGNIISGNGKVVINGKEYQGRNITIVGNQVMIDGKVYEGNEEEKAIHIVINGDVESLDLDSCEEISIYGNAKIVKTVSGNVKCNVIEGNVSTTSGDVITKEIKGSVSTMSGDIIER